MNNSTLKVTPLHAPQKRNQITSNSSRFIVTLSRKFGASGQTNKTVIWNTEKPLPVGHPFRWIVEKTPTGFRIRDLQATTASKAVTELSSKDILKGIKHPLSKELTIQIKATHVLPAAYDSSHDTQGEMTVFACTGKWIRTSEKFNKKYTATLKSEKIFTLKKSGNQYSLEPTTSGVQILSHSSAAQSISGAIQLSKEALMNSTIVFQGQSWKFGQVQIQSIPNVSVVDPRTNEENWLYRKSLIGSAIMIAALLVTSIFITPEEEEKKDDVTIPAQYTKIVMQQQNTKPSAMQPQGGKSSASPQKKADNSQLAQAFRTKALQNAVSGLLQGGMTSLLAQSDLVNQSKSAKQAGEVFSGPSVKTHSGFKGMAEGRKVNVAALGGSATSKDAVGYGHGEKANVQGQGNSFVDLDTMGADVAQGLTKDEVGRVIHSHLSEVRYCYESSMIRTPDIEGKLLVDFTIGASGRVISSAINKSTLPDPRLDDCILRRLVKWAFPKPKGGVNVSVTYPFIFKSLGR